MFTNRQAHQFNIDFWSWFRQFVYNIPETSSCVGTKPYRIEVLFTNNNGDFDKVSGTKRECSATVLRVAPPPPPPSQISLLSKKPPFQGKEVNKTAALLSLSSLPSPLSFYSKTSFGRRIWPRDYLFTR